MQEGGEIQVGGNKVREIEELQIELYLNGSKLCKKQLSCTSVRSSEYFSREMQSLIEKSEIFIGFHNYKTLIEGQRKNLA